MLPHSVKGEMSGMGKSNDDDYEKEFWDKIVKEKQSSIWMNALYGIGILIGIGILLYFTSAGVVLKFVYTNSLQLSFAIIAISVMGIVRNLNKDKNFIDVDLKRYYSNKDNIFTESTETIKDYDTTIIGRPVSAFAGEATSNIDKDTFVYYFHSITKSLKDKSDDADAKASILLDRGIKFTKYGIGFYLISIITWQYLSYQMEGFKEQFIYGIISCSLLFIFIEFLSAWFLKQYRNYIDTSTYLLKVKEIFDRYLLTYFALIECPVDDASGKTHTKHIFSLLAEEIKWPDKLMIDGKDIGFAKEAMDVMSTMIKTIKSEAGRNKKSKDSKEDEN
jgi:hypothetical protein